MNISCLSVLVMVYFIISFFAKKKKKRKKKRDYTSARAFQRKWEWNRKGEEAPYFEDMLTLYLDVFGV